MLTCITCSKGLEEGPIGETELNGSTTPRSLASKETIDNLTAMVKDLSLKLSKVYTQCKPFRTSLESDNETPEIPKSYGSGFGSSTSTPTSSSASSSKPAPGTPAPPMLNIIVLFEEEESREWVVEADTGVFITLLSKPKGKNHLRRVRFSKENFDKWHAQLWWVENYDKIVELYNVERSVIPNNKIRRRRRVAKLNQGSYSTQSRDVTPVSTKH